jgi:hypothetical protein
MTDCSRSAPRTKRRGERGSPCLTPLLYLNSFPGTPFSKTKEEPEERIALIHEIQLSEKTFMLHNLQNHLMLNFIKCFLKIKL